MLKLFPNLENKRTHVTALSYNVPKILATKRDTQQATTRTVRQEVPLGSSSQVGEEVASNRCPLFVHTAPTQRVEDASGICMLAEHCLILHYVNQCQTLIEILYQNQLNYLVEKIFNFSLPHITGEVSNVNRSTGTAAHGADYGERLSSLLEAHKTGEYKTTGQNALLDFKRTSGHLQKISLPTDKISGRQLDMKTESYEANQERHLWSKRSPSSSTAPSLAPGSSTAMHDLDTPKSHCLSLSCIGLGFIIATPSHGRPLMHPLPLYIPRSPIPPSLPPSLPPTSL